MVRPASSSQVSRVRRRSPSPSAPSTRATRRPASAGPDSAVLAAASRPTVQQFAAFSAIRVRAMFTARSSGMVSGALAKAASGALETMPLLRAVNIARTLIALKAANCWTVGLDAAAKTALSGPALAGRRVALVLGAEGEGLRRLTRETCDELAGLTMPGAMESLNVSAAGAVALYELTRRA